MTERVLGRRVGGLDFKEEPYVEVYLANGRSLVIPLTLEEGRAMTDMDLLETLQFVDVILTQGYDDAIGNRKKLH